MKVLYSTKATATGGRDGIIELPGTDLKFTMVRPKEMGGPGAGGVNPEQLFASGYSACFLSAMHFLATKEKKPIPKETTVTAQVGIGPNDAGGFALDVELQVHIPGMGEKEAMEAVEKAHQVCPYSNATRNGLQVRLKIV